MAFDIKTDYFLALWLEHQVDKETQGTGFVRQTDYSAIF